jgi:hypothetical protein
VENGGKMKSIIMTQLDDVKERKKQTETKLFDAIKALLTTFQDDTGLSVSGIDINFSKEGKTMTGLKIHLDMTDEKLGMEAI